MALTMDQSEKPPVLEVKKMEVVPPKTIVQTAETKAETVKISQDVYDILTNAIAFNLGAAVDIPNLPTTSLLGEFQAAFTALYQQSGQKIDFKNFDDVKRMAGDYLTKGGGKALLSAIKLMEWQGALFSAASKSCLKIETLGKLAQSQILGAEGTKYFLDSSGLDEIPIEEPKPDETKQSRIAKIKAAVAKKLHLTHEAETETRAILSMQVGDNVDYGSLITDPIETAYLSSCGLVRGTDLKADPKAQELIRKTLVNIAKARTRLLLQTDVSDFTQIQDELNFIKVDPSGSISYLPTRSPHFLDESATSYQASNFAKEGAIKVREVRNEVQKKVKEEIEAAERTDDEARITRKLGNRKQALEKPSLEEEEKTKKEAEIQREIDELDKKINDFTKQRELETEISGATEILTETSGKVTERARYLIAHRTDLAGQNEGFLIEWSGSGDKSLAKLLNELEQLRQQEKPITDRIARLTEERNALRQALIQLGGIGLGGAEEESGAQATAVPHADESITQEILTEYRAAKTNLDTEREKLEKPQDGDTESLESKITALERRATLMRGVLEDEETKNIIKSFREAEKKLEAKKTEKGKVDIQVKNHVPSGKNVQDAEKDFIEQKKNKTKEKDNVGKPEKDQQREIDCISAILKIYTPTEQEQREKRILTEERAIAAGLKREVISERKFDDYPPALRRCLQLIFGPDVLDYYPDDTKRKEMLAIIESDRYLEIFIDEIEKAANITDVKDKLGNLANNPEENHETTAQNLRQMIQTKGDKLMSVPINIIDKEVINNILKRLGDRAQLFSSP